MKTKVSIKFYLKNPKSKTPTLIYVFIRSCGKRSKLSCEKKINPKLWDFKKQRPKKVFGVRDLNNHLNLIEKLVKTIFINHTY